MKGDPRLAALDRCEKRAYDLILGDGGKVFDLGREKDALDNGTAVTRLASPVCWATHWLSAACPL